MLEQTADCHRCNREFSFDWHSDYRIWYKEENQITAGVFPDFSRESRLDDGILGILILITGILYILARKITRKPHMHLLEGCIILAGLLMGIGFIAIQELL